MPTLTLTLNILLKQTLLLIEGDSLLPRYKDHSLSGNWNHHRDCHIEPDWLLLYKIDGDDLHLIRTGTHADLF